MRGWIMGQRAIGACAAQVCAASLILIGMLSCSRLSCKARLGCCRDGASNSRPSSRPFALDLLLQIDDRLDQLLRPRRTAGHVHVDRDEAVDPLHDA